MALVTVFGGGFQDAEGNPLALGTVTARLQQDVLVGTSQICAGRLVTLVLDVNGNVTPSPGTQLWPATYLMKAYTAAGQNVWSGTVTVPNTTSFSLTP